MKVEYKNNLFVVDGKYFTIKYKNGIPIMTEVKKKDVKTKAKLIDELTEKLKDNLDRDVIMKEALWNLKLDYLKKINKTLKTKKCKPKTREGACADMKVGKHIIPIVR